MPVSSLLCLQSDPQLDAECLGASWNFDWSTVPLSNRAENAMNANLFVVDSMWLSCTVRRDFWPSWHFALLLSQGWKPHEKFAKQVLERRMGSVGWLDRMEMLHGSHFPRPVTLSFPVLQQYSALSLFALGMCSYCVTNMCEICTFHLLNLLYYWPFFSRCWMPWCFSGVETGAPRHSATERGAQRSYKHSVVMWSLWMWSVNFSPWLPRSGH